MNRQIDFLIRKYIESEQTVFCNQCGNKLMIEDYSCAITAQDYEILEVLYECENCNDKTSLRK